MKGNTKKEETGIVVFLFILIILTITFIDFLAKNESPPAEEAEETITEEQETGLLEHLWELIGGIE